MYKVDIGLRDNSDYTGLFTGRNTPTFIFFYDIAAWRVSRQRCYSRSCLILEHNIMKREWHWPATCTGEAEAAPAQHKHQHSP